jgi:hypothetical protein
MHTDAISPALDGQEDATRPSAGHTGHLDDWGFFDPQQVGFGALVGRLNEITGAGRQRNASRW